MATVAKQLLAGITNFMNYAFCFFFLTVSCVHVQTEDLQGEINAIVRVN